MSAAMTERELVTLSLTLVPQIKYKPTSNLAHSKGRVLEGDYLALDW